MLLRNRGKPDALIALGGEKGGLWKRLIWIVRLAGVEEASHRGAGEQP